MIDIAKFENKKVEVFLNNGNSIKGYCLLFCDKDEFEADEDCIDVENDKGIRSIYQSEVARIEILE